jgi:hypothetical protein
MEQDKLSFPLSLSLALLYNTHTDNLSFLPAVKYSHNRYLSLLYPYVSQEFCHKKEIGINRPAFLKAKRGEFLKLTGTDPEMKNIVYFDASL